MNLRRRLEHLEASAPTPPREATDSGRCEDLYLQELEWYEAGESGLVHDSEAEVFYAPEGEFALSRHKVNLPVWIDA